MILNYKAIQDYAQPSFYRFSDDSIFLVSKVLETENKNSYTHVLDLCAGCGVVGLEFSKSVNIDYLDFIELQSSFTPFIEQNIQTFASRSMKTMIYNTSFSRFEKINGYDLILSNPPYFNVNTSRSSENKERDICRRFIVDDYESFFNFVKRMLNVGGKAYFLLPLDNLSIIPDNFNLIAEKKRIGVFSFLKKDL